MGYDFKVPTYVYKVSGKIRIGSYKIQYSDDLTNWFDCATGWLAGSADGDYFSCDIDEGVGKHRYWIVYTNRPPKSDWGALFYTLRFYN